MLTYAQIYRLASLIYLFRPLLTATAIYENGGSKVVDLLYSLFLKQNPQKLCEYQKLLLKKNSFEQKGNSGGVCVRVNRVALFVL